MNIFSRVILAVVLLSVVFQPLYASGQLFVEGNPLVGKKAPEFTLATTNGGVKNFTESRSGKNAIVFFWATWCPHCRKQLGTLKEQKNQIEEKGIQIVLVDVGETKEKVKAFIENQQIPFDVFLDEESTLSEAYSVIGVPSFFFVDKNGVVRQMEFALPENYAEIFKESDS